MDTTKILNHEQPQTLSPSNSGRRRCSDCNSSPEFEFWMLRNPIYPQPDLHSADELFSDGVLLPLHLLPATNKPDQSTEPSQPDPEEVASEAQVHDPDPEPGPGPESSPAITESSSSSTLSASKRWKDIFRKKNTEEKEKAKGKKKDRRTGSGAGSAELNINIWPFSRSRSAGNTGTRPKLFPGAPTRKVNSAPCSRSNSGGESKSSRKWPSSPGRGGVHVGRSSPVWQVRRGKNPETQAPNGATCRRSKVASSSTARARVLNLNVPMCVGYRPHLSCRSDENSAIGCNTNIRGDEGVVDRGSGSNHFNLRNLFSKKNIVTSH